MATTTSAPLGSRGGHLVFCMVLVGQTLLLSSQVTTEAGHSALRSLLIGLFSPIQRSADTGLGAISSFWYGYVDLRGVREENGRLKEDLARLEQALWMERDVVASYRRLSTVLDLAERIPGNPVVAEVVGLDASAWFQTVTVNRGTAHGVALNAPVIAAGGLVGRVISVGTDVAQIQLLTDRDCSVGALLARTRARGVVAGSGGEASPTGLTLNYVSNLEDVVEGDLDRNFGNGRYLSQGHRHRPRGLGAQRSAALQARHRRAGRESRPARGGFRPRSSLSQRDHRARRVRVLDIVVALLAAFIFQTVLGRYLPFLNGYLDLFVVVAAGFGLVRGRMAGLHERRFGGASSGCLFRRSSGIQRHLQDHSRLPGRDRRSTSHHPRLVHSHPVLLRRDPYRSTDSRRCGIRGGASQGDGRGARAALPLYRECIGWYSVGAGPGAAISRRAIKDRKKDGEERKDGKGTQSRKENSFTGLSFAGLLSLGAFAFFLD